MWSMSHLIKAILEVLYGLLCQNNSAAGLGRGVVVCIIYEAVLQHPANSVCDDLKFIQDHNNINVLASVVNKEQAPVVQKVDSATHRIKNKPSPGWWQWPWFSLFSYLSGR